MWLQNETGSGGLGFGVKEVIPFSASRAKLAVGNLAAAHRRLSEYKMNS